MPPEDYDKRIYEETSKLKKMEEQLNKTRINILKTVKERKRVETEYLDAAKKQIEYWKGRLDATDPEKDEERYNELKKEIEMEESHIKLIQDELNRINKEIKMETEHKK